MSALDYILIGSLILIASYLLWRADKIHQATKEIYSKSVAILRQQTQQQIAEASGLWEHIAKQEERISDLEAELKKEREE